MNEALDQLPLYISYENSSNQQKCTLPWGQDKSFPKSIACQFTRTGGEQCSNWCVVL